MALKDKKKSSGRTVEPSMANAIRARLKDGRLDCVAAFVLAKETGINPLAVGEAADSLGVRLSHCQLGLFGFPGHSKAWETPGWRAAKMPEGLEAAVRSSLESDGSLSCASAWTLADRFGVGRVQVGFLAGASGIKVKRCQLGAF